MSRGQVPLSLVEVAIGTVLIFAVGFGFALGTPTPDTREPQLSAYAEDAATILANEPARHEQTTRLHEIVADKTTFEREREILDRRVRRILPANVLFSVRTPHGSVGMPVPRGVTTGTARIPTGTGTVRIEVWYA